MKKTNGNVRPPNESRWSATFQKGKKREKKENEQRKEMAARAQSGLNRINRDAAEC